jgi:hypothetical protein
MELGLLSKEEILTMKALRLQRKQVTPALLNRSTFNPEEWLISQTRFSMASNALPLRKICPVMAAQQSDSPRDYLHRIDTLDIGVRNVELLEQFWECLSD